MLLLAWVLRIMDSDSIQSWITKSRQVKQVFTLDKRPECCDWWKLQMNISLHEDFMNHIFWNALLFSFKGNVTIYERAYEGAVVCQHHSTLRGSIKTGLKPALGWSHAMKNILQIPSFHSNKHWLTVDTHLVYRLILKHRPCSGKT